MKKHLLPLAYGLILLSFAACETASKTPSKNSDIKSNVGNSANLLPTGANTANPTNAVNALNTNNFAAKSEIKTGKGEGKVTKINLEIGSIEMNHGEITGEAKMPPMLMEFYVKDKAIPEGLKVGDTVTFTLEDNKGAEQITDVKKK